MPMARAEHKCPRAEVRLPALRAHLSACVPAMVHAVTGSGFVDSSCLGRASDGQSVRTSGTFLRISAWLMAESDQLVANCPIMPASSCSRMWQ